MAQREIRYCTTDDGARIAYCVDGDGPTTILALPAFNESFALDHLMPVYQLFYRDLGVGRRIVRFDRRGQGLSTEGRTLPDKFYGDGPLDLAAVARAVGPPVTRVGADALGAASALVLQRAPGARRSDPLYGTYAIGARRVQETMLDALERLVAANYETALQTIADMNGRRDFPVEAGQLGEWYVRSETQEHYLLRARWFRESEEYFPDFSSITASAMVLHRIGDPAIPFSAGQKLAASLPNARLVPLAGEGHLFCLGDYSNILAAVDEFIWRPACRHRRGLRRPRRERR